MAPGSASKTELAAHYGICGAELRAKNRDLWLAALYAPAPLRPHLHALHAFCGEIGEISAKVTQPLLGEMRLRWWVDALADGEGARAHPVADALIATIAACGLAREEFTDFLDASSAELYDDQIESISALFDHFRRVAARPLLWSARCLRASDRPETRQALEDAGLAMGLTRLLLSLEQGKGRQFVPPELSSGKAAAHGPEQELLRLAIERYEAARKGEAQLDEPARIALLPAAILPLYFASLPAQKGEPSPLRRQWRLWRAARKGL